jgi:uncharacterized membrane protein YfcA
MQNWLGLLVVFFAVFTQSLTGFGSGLVSMAFLPDMLGVRTAVPMVALITGTLELILLIRFREAFNIKAVWRMALTTLLGIPLGVWALRGLSEKILLPGLGVVMTGYALYALFNLKLPRLEHPAWAYLTGFLSGLLSGAYSVGGPPVIIYGNCRGWQPDEFKSNLQAFFLLNDGLAIVYHAIAGNLTHPVWTGYLWALPMVGVGLLAGAGLDRFLNPQIFRKLVLVMLVIMGVRLFLMAFTG